MIFTLILFYFMQTPFAPFHYVIHVIGKYTSIQCTLQVPAVSLCIYYDTFI